uniref:50S ribosomal protein L35 n=1 Tax=Coccolithus braarudii TaxID=221442 RepID=A0A7S0L6M8_9EUKA|mmetsp:Transcript_23358/g.50414  ORF Transcript_23358/g.50414 Transcript_23358/m.50414 type:complete len:123 (+) Transcript_23358:66-434(+)
MRTLCMLCVFFAAVANALMLPTVTGSTQLAPAASCTRAADVYMTSLNKKAKAACRKAKSSRAATKRFKPTATGKLLRRKAFKAHILTKKHPLRKQSLRRISAVDETQLKTMQKLLLVVPKRS